MIKVSVEGSDGSVVQIERPETHTLDSEGLKHVVRPAKWTAEGLLTFWDRGMRYFTDGAPLIPKPKYENGKLVSEPTEEEVSKAKDKRQKAVDRKIRALEGEEVIRTRESMSDPVAALLRKHVSDRLVAKKVMKRAKIPKLGGTVKEVSETAKALGLTKAWIAKAVKVSEAEAERAKTIRDSLIEE